MTLKARLSTSNHANMSTKDYIQLANVFVGRFNKIDQYYHGAEKIHASTELLTVLEDLIVVLQNDNPRFKKTRFIDYINSNRIEGGGVLLTS